MNSTTKTIIFLTCLGMSYDLTRRCAVYEEEEGRHHLITQSLRDALSIAATSTLSRRISNIDDAAERTVTKTPEVILFLDPDCHLLQASREKTVDESRAVIWL